METHCIDVFFSDGQFPIHILTAGSILPDELNDILRNRTLQEETERYEGSVANLSCSTNSAFVKTLLDRHGSIIDAFRKTHQAQGIIEEYYPQPTAEQISSRFLHYAKLGFYSYDCYEVNEDGTAIYRLMAWPNQIQQLSYQLPHYTPKRFDKTGMALSPPEYIEM